MNASLNPDRLRSFVHAFARLVSGPAEEAGILAAGADLLADLTAHDDWLPEAFARPDPERYTQYLLHRDAQARFSVVSFVWAPDQATPIHNHTVWGLVGVLRGAELSQAFTLNDGKPVAGGPPHRLERGQVEAVSPSVGDIHRVSNALSDRPSVSIHVYGADIGAVRRSVYEPDGTERSFISGYANPDGPFGL